MTAVEQLDSVRPLMAPVVLPDVLRRPEFRFCKAGFDLSGLQRAIDDAKSSDAPEKAAESALRRFKAPKGAGWQQAGYAHDDRDLTSWLKAGGNYGIIAGTAWEVDGHMARLFILDADDVKAWAEAGFFDDLPKSTLTVQSSAPGKLHYYYWTDLESSKAHFELPGRGHLKFWGSQCVGPGSLHPSGCRYTVIDPSSPAYVPREVLEKAILRAVAAMAPDRLQAVKDMFGVKPDHADRLKANANKLEENARQVKIGRIKRTQAEERGDVPEDDVKARPDDLPAVMARIECDDRINPCLRRLIAGLPANHRFEAMVGVNGKPGEGEHALRRAVAVAWIKSGYTDEEFRLLAANFDDYNPSRTQQQLDSVHRGIEDKGITYSPCRELQAHIPPEFCDGCSWTPPNPAAEELKEIFGKGNKKGGGSNRVMDLINARITGWIKEHHFKTAKDTGRLYHYEHGVYLDDGEVLLEELVEEEFPEHTSNKLIADVVGKVKRRTYVDRDAFNAGHFLNVKNGLLDLDTLELKPHTPDYLSTAQINAAYDENAKAPSIQKFLREVARPEDVALIEELIGWLLWPDYNIHVAVMLLGPGRNGKGTLLRLITAFLGQKSIANVTLQDLVADRFAKADLYGKMANIGGDLPAKDLSDTAAFRNLTGGDDNRAQEKYRSAFNFRNKAKMLFSANQLPRSPDDTYAYYSRWILLEFLHTFDPRSGTGDPDLDSKLQKPEELSGLLNIALAGLKRLRENGWRFSYDKTVEDVEIMYKRNANPVVAFLMDECEEAPDSYVEKSVLQSRFRRYCEKHGIRPITVTRFGNLLKDQSVIPISDYRPHDPTGRVGLPRCWLGLKFKDPSNASTPSIVLPNPSITAKRDEEEKSKESSKGEIGYTESVDGVDARDAARHDHFAAKAAAVAVKERPPGGDSQQAPPGPAAHPGSGPHEPVEKPATAVMTPFDYEKAASDEWVALVRFNTDYKTDLGGMMCDFAEGDETVVSLDRAITWKNRGAAAILWVDAALPEAAAAKTPQQQGITPLACANAAGPEVTA